MEQEILLTEAATRIGKTATTLRKLINAGRLEATKDKQGRNLVRMDAVLAHYALSTNQRTGASRSLEQTPTGVEQELRARILLLERELSRSQALADSMLAKNDVLASEIVKLNAEMRAMQEKHSPEDGIVSQWIRMQEVKQEESLEPGEQIKRGFLKAFEKYSPIKLKSDSK